MPIHKVSPAAAKENGSKDGVVWATALYDFTAENDSELSLKVSELLARQGLRLVMKGFISHCKYQSSEKLCVFEGR